MRVRDANGLALSGASAEAAALYDAALRQFQIYGGDPLASLKTAVADSPGFVMAHLMRGWLLALSTEARLLAPARAALAAAEALPMDARERGHATALAHLLDGRWAAASAVLEDLTIEHPRDVLALQAGHVIDFYRGDARLLRDRIARALPAWSEAMPSWHAILAMRAFGLEETGDYARAEAAGRRAVELEPANGWGQHAVAHVLEMQGRAEEGIAWMSVAPQAWAEDSFFAVHNWWHLALYHLELGDIDAALALYDGPVRGGRSTMLVDLIDASALLWRLVLRGADVGDRWQAVAEGWAPHAGSGNYAFNDVHAMMAFLGAGRREAIAALEAAQARAEAQAGDNALFTREVGRPAAQAMRAFAEGDYERTIALLRPIRSIAHRFGGSHAQRDVLDLTLLEAALRAGRAPLARALAAERLAAKPESPLARAFIGRAGALAA